jgi:uncharacterized metal-binding protein YceD (DUF177 family)
MTEKSDLRPEFSVEVALDDLPDEGASYRLSADEAAREALSKRFGLVGLGRFDAEVTLNWVKRGKVLALTGHVSADVVQSCVVTLEPVPATVEEDIGITFARDVDAAAEVIDPDEAEPLEGEILDIGEIVSEELSLALDPYPRSPNIDPAALALGPGASYMTEDEAVEGDSAKNRPFEVLAGLRPKH